MKSGKTILKRDQKANGGSAGSKKKILMFESPFGDNFRNN
jgi:hypothetical protein